MYLPKVAQSPTLKQHMHFIAPASKSQSADQRRYVQIRDPIEGTTLGD